MFERLERLINKDNLEKLNKLNILLVGIGGVGGFALEALVRCNIGNITIIDGDSFDISNLNRQIISNYNNIGLSKVEEGIKRAKNINPDINIKGINSFITEEYIKKLDNYDYILDACDDIPAKIALIKYAQSHNIKIISAMGTGKRMDPSKVKITTLNKSFNDPLAKVMRKKVKEEGLSLNIPIVYSEEPPINNDAIIASCIFIPSVAGISMVYYIVNDALKNS